MVENLLCGRSQEGGKQSVNAAELAFLDTWPDRDDDADEDPARHAEKCLDRHGRIPKTELMGAGSM